MKITQFGTDGIPLPLGTAFTGVTAIGSNAIVLPGGPVATNFVQLITANSSNSLQNPIVNFASGVNVTLAVASNTITISGTGGGGGMSSGTSNPAQPAYGNNLPFFRTDLDLIIYYDGTRWLTTTLFKETFGIAGAVTPISATNNIGYISPFTEFDLWLVAAYVSTYVLTTNNGTNFWTIAVRKQDAAGTPTTIVSYTTAAHTASNWTHVRTLIGASYVAASFRILDLTATKTLSAGNLYWAGALTYRLIVT